MAATVPVSLGVNEATRGEKKGMVVATGNLGYEVRRN